MQVKFIDPAAAVISCRILRLSLSAFAAYKAQSAFVVSAVALGISALTIIVAAFDAAAVKADALVKDFGPEAIFAAGGNSVEVPLGNCPLTLTLKDIAAIRTALPGVAKAEPFLLVENVTARAGQGRHEVARAVGATKSHILRQFMLEATLLSSSGGVAGVACALLFARLIFAGGGLPAVFSPIVTLGVCLISSACGMLAGLYPAWRATRVEILDVLKSS